LSLKSEDRREGERLFAKRWKCRRMEVGGKRSREGGIVNKKKNLDSLKEKSALSPKD